MSPSVGHTPPVRVQNRDPVRIPNKSPSSSPRGPQGFQAVSCSQFPSEAEFPSRDLLGRRAKTTLKGW